MKYQVIGPRRSGKSTLVKHLRDMGYDVFESDDDEEDLAKFEKYVPESAAVDTHFAGGERRGFIHAERYWRMHEREKAKDGNWMRMVLDDTLCAKLDAKL